MAAGKSAQELQKLTAAEPRNAAAWHQLGNALLDEGKADRGISAFRRALRIDDSLAEVHNDLGAAYFDKRWYGEAEACFRKAIAARPDHGVAYANLGAALRAQGRIGEGRRAYQRALLLKLRGLLPRFLRWRVGAAPAQAVAPSAERERLCEEAGKALGGAHTRAQQREALELALRAAQSFPGDAEVSNLCAKAYAANREYDLSLAHARAAVELKPDTPEYQLTLANALLRTGDLGGAMNAATRASKLEPGSAPLHAAVAGFFQGWRDDVAEQLARHAVDLDAACDVAHANLAAALWGQGRLKEAEQSAREAIRLNADYLAFRVNLAMILKDQARVDEARAIYQELLREAPEHGKLCTDFASLAYETEGDLAAARSYYRRAQASTDDPRAYMGEALVDFMEERFEAAWAGYESRKRLTDQRTLHDVFASIAEWDGAALPAGRLLVYGEQGLGDEIMLASMLPELARRQPGVVLLCDPRLGTLFARSFPGFEVIAENKDRQLERVKSIPDIACKVAAGSLGRYFRRRREDFPDHRGYLQADPARVERWRARLEGPGLKVGLSWIGGVQKTGRSRRSVSLEDLRSALELPGVQWVSLQYTDAEAEIAALQKSRGLEVRHFPGVTRDMDELAGLVGALDLVVSVCNTTVHVAGATGKEILVLAPFVPEWRYGRSGERMVWYPSARVLRQAAYGDWRGVIARVAGELQARLAAGGAPHVVDQ